MDPHSVSGPTDGVHLRQTQPAAAENPLGKYLDYNVSNDPNLNTTVLGATLSEPIIFLGFWAIRAVLLVHS